MINSTNWKNFRFGLTGETPLKNNAKMKIQVPNQNQCTLYNKVGCEVFIKYVPKNPLDADWGHRLIIARPDEGTSDNVKFRIDKVAQVLVLTSMGFTDEKKKYV